MDENKYLFIIIDRKNFKNDEFIQREKLSFNLFCYYHHRIYTYRYGIVQCEIKIIKFKFYVEKIKWKWKFMHWKR